MIDAVDRQIIHALQSAPRARFALVAEVLGVSEQTVARRYRRLRDAGVIRVVGRLATASVDHRTFLVRIRCLPERVVAVAEAIARRPEVTFVQLTVGGAEIVCLVDSPVPGPDDDLLLGRLPRAGAVLDVAVHLAFHRFGNAAADDWTGFPDGLDDARQRALSCARVPRGADAIAPAAADKRLFAVLADDGRATYAALAAATGWSQERAAQRVRALEASATLVFDVDLLPHLLGFRTHALLWLSVQPAHLDALGTLLAARPEVVFAAAATGRHNLVAVVICRDEDDLYHYLTATIAAMPGVTGYEISLTGRTVKQSTSFVIGGRLRGRHERGRPDTYQ